LESTKKQNFQSFIGLPKTAACLTRHSSGAGSIPAWGSAKTNEEVLAKLLT